jgi:hypothetical protein
MAGAAAGNHDIAITRPMVASFVPQNCEKPPRLFASL